MLASQQITWRRAVASQPERTAAARQAIIAAAVEVLGTEGHRALTNARLQEVSGLSRGLAGYHFGSRQGLLEAVIESIRDDFVTDLVTSPAAGPAPGLGALVRLADTYLSELARDPRRNLAVLVLTAASVRELPELQPAIGQLDDSLRRGIAELLTRGAADGSVSASTEIPAAAAAILALLRGATLQWLASPRGIDLDAIRRETTAILTRCYGSPADRPRPWAAPRLPPARKRPGH
jgi:AcrR family transcriptional regulator